MVGDLLTADELRGNAERRVNESLMADRIALPRPSGSGLFGSPALPPGLRSSARTLGGTEDEARRYRLLDESVVLL